MVSNPLQDKYADWIAEQCRSIPWGRLAGHCAQKFSRRDRSFTTLAALSLSCRRLCMSESLSVRLPHPARGRLAGLQGQKLRRNLIWALMALPALIWISVFNCVTLFGVSSR